MQRKWRPTIPGMVWVAVWTFPLLNPLSTVHTAAAGAGLIAFELLYVYSAAAGFDNVGPPRYRAALVATVAVLGLVLAAVHGEQWLILMLFAAVCAVSTYGGEERPVAAIWLFAAVVAATVAVGVLRHVTWVTIGTVVVSSALASGLVGAVRQMSRLIGELHHTRQALADAAVAEERLRFSRDLHDLLGHTLSVVVVKAEAVRRLAERDPAAAAVQAADIEQIGRRALVEIREAVTGYRETGLTAELARARGALTAAGIAADVLRTADPLPESADRLLAWVVREATTNVIRHSKAARCDIALSTSVDAVLLSVSDDGPFAGPAAPAPGNGLRGLKERLCADGGTLHLAPRPGGGLTLEARLPL